MTNLPVSTIAFALVGAFILLSLLVIVMRGAGNSKHYSQRRKNG